ncbi:recombinase family protein [Dactylosporangium sp. NPDC050688]|uniref:recombinase family protein n=1 Tax=Dactylosporangium sp. NPDC050688 TaxID=3157217 RepID=UPI0033E08E7A
MSPTSPPYRRIHSQPCGSATAGSPPAIRAPAPNPDALTAAGCEQIFVDKASGKLARRPELSKALLVAHRRGDQFVVTKFGLGRSLEHLIDLPAQLQERGVDLVGLAAARARGRTGGQKPKLTLRQARIARQIYEEVGPGGRRVHTVEQIAAEFGVTRPTIYRHLAKLPADAG